MTARAWHVERATEDAKREVTALAKGAAVAYAVDGTLTREQFLAAIDDAIDTYRATVAAQFVPGLAGPDTSADD